MLVLNAFSPCSDLEVETKQKERGRPSCVPKQECGNMSKANQVSMIL